jgi:hypothetical protein
MAEKIGKVECKTISQMPRSKVLIHFSLYKFRKHNTAAGHHTAMKTWHIKRNSIVQIEISIGYKTKWF